MNVVLHFASGFTSVNSAVKKIVHDLDVDILTTFGKVRNEYFMERVSSYTHAVKEGCKMNVTVVFRNNNKLTIKNVLSVAYDSDKHIITIYRENDVPAEFYAEGVARVITEMEDN